MKFLLKIVLPLSIYFWVHYNAGPTTVRPWLLVGIEVFIGVIAVFIGIISFQGKYRNELIMVLLSCLLIIDISILDSSRDFNSDCVQCEIESLYERSRRRRTKIQVKGRILCNNESVTLRKSEAKRLYLRGMREGQPLCVFIGRGWFNVSTYKIEWNE